MKKSNFALRLPPSLMDEARKLAKSEGVAVNQLINVAVAEKLSALRTEDYFAERAARGDLKKALRVLKRAGAGKPPLAGDELSKSPAHAKHGSKPTRDQRLDEDLRFAITNKRLLQLSYAGRLRVIEPHDYGIRDGKTSLLAYQRRADSGASPKDVRGWRLFDVSRIDRCIVLEDSFEGSRAASHQRHYVWEVVYARVA
jgi:predicted DNA-binding transcriptional regulator YafY